MPPLGTRHVLLTFAACLYPALVSATPFPATENQADGLSERSNNYNIPCGNAPNVKAGDPVTAADIVVPSQDEGPPTATNDSSGYFPYVWCSAGTSTYVFIDPIGSFGFNKGTNEPVFWTGLDGAVNVTQNEMKARASLGENLPTGDTSIDSSGQPNLTLKIPINDVPGVNFIQIYAQDANHQKLTYGTLANAFNIMRDFATNYPLYADSMYFQINDGRWSTVGNGYMGVVSQAADGTLSCMLKPGVGCTMPSNLCICLVYRPST